jgi:hypothetical protein
MEPRSGGEAHFMTSARSCESFGSACGVEVGGVHVGLTVHVGADGLETEQPLRAR